MEHELHSTVLENLLSFIDSSKHSLKCVLLHNGNKYGSIPIAHSTKLKEEYDTIAFVMKKIKYHEHQWVIDVYLKMVNFLLGQHGGYAKYPCFLCLWDSRSKQTHWIRKEWPVRSELIVGERNVLHKSLVERDRIILPSLLIKIGLMKQFMRALHKDSPCFRYIEQKMPEIITEKLKARIFDVPKIRQLIGDPYVLQSIIETE